MEKHTPYKDKTFGGSSKSIIIKTFSLFLIIYILQDFIVSFKILLFLLTPFVATCYIWFKALQTGDSFTQTFLNHTTFIPMAYTEREWQLDKKIRITYIIILINVLVHYLSLIGPDGSHEILLKLFSFLPHEGGVINYLLSPLFSIFLHSDFSHLGWNMLFLWIFGIVVERRIGWKRFLMLYLATGVIGDLLVASIKFITGSIYHSYGASGAISGIMGVFLIRLSFKKMIFPIPILGILSFLFPLNFKFRLNSMFVIGMFFALDLSGGIKQITGESSSRIGHWSHLAGTIMGILLSLRLKLQEEAYEEKHLDAGLKALGDEGIINDGINSLKKVIEKNPENVTALLALAREKSRSRPTKGGFRYYQRVLKILIKSDTKQAADVFKEFMKKYPKNLEPELQYNLSGLLHRAGDNKNASKALERLIGPQAVDEHIREKSLFQLAHILEAMELPDLARFRYQQLLEEYPHSDKTNIVKSKLKNFNK